MEEKIRLAVFGQKRLSREGGIEIVVKELCTRMAQNGCDVTCYNRAGHHVSGAEYDKTIEYDGIVSNIACNTTASYSTVYFTNIRRNGCRCILLYLFGCILLSAFCNAWNWKPWQSKCGCCKR